jgi:hypothetical protein
MGAFIALGTCQAHRMLHEAARGRLTMSDILGAISIFALSFGIFSLSLHCKMLGKKIDEQEKKIEILSLEMMVKL